MQDRASNAGKRIAIASFEFEGNDFSQKINGQDLFVPNASGQAMWSAIEGHQLAVTGAKEVLEAAGVTLIPILVAQSQAGAKVEDGFYRETFVRLVEGIRNCGPLDGIYLALHGAMVSGGVTDAEGDLLTALREIVGPRLPIAVSLDLHAHVTRKMVDNATVLVGYANYPHDDAYTTGKRAAAFLRDTIAGSLKPVMRAVRLSMIVPVTGSCTAIPDAPLAKVQKLARSLENETLVSTSYFTVQPWLDDDDACTVALAISHSDADKAEAAAARIAEALWQLRDEFALPLYSPQEAIMLSRGMTTKPVILSDEADSVGAGSAGDAAYLLKELIAHASDLRVAVAVTDAVVAAKAKEAGVGATLDVTIGFRDDIRNGAPVRISARVLHLHSGEFTYTGGPMGGVTVSMGTTAVLECGQIQLLVTSLPTYEYAGEQYEAAGIDIAKCDIAVFKNGMNFRMSVPPGGTFLFVEGVGSSSGSLAKLPWKNRISKFWPRDLDIENPVKN